jgi:hypothetical protein
MVFPMIKNTYAYVSDPSPLAGEGADRRMRVDQYNIFIYD